MTIAKDINVKRVLADGTTEVDAAGTKSYELTPGRFVLYLVSENEAETEKYELATYESSDYRDDAASVFITADENASGGYRISAMGDPSWAGYSAIIPNEGGRTITPRRCGCQLGLDIQLYSDCTDRYVRRYRS